MKRKRFLAVLTAASLSASMALTAMPVFAGDVVSVEASDAATYGGQSVTDDNFKKDLTAALANAYYPSTTTSYADLSTKNASDFGLALSGYQFGNFKVVGRTAPSYASTATGGQLVMPTVTVQADVEKGTDTFGSTTNTAYGTITFTTETTALEKTEQVAAAKAIIEGVGGTASDAAKYKNEDNSTSLKKAVGDILKGNSTVLPDIVNADGTLKEGVTVSQSSISAATKSAAGSEGVSVDFKIKLKDSAGNNNTTDPSYDASKTGDQYTTGSASYTTTIKKLGVDSGDADYQAKVEAALKNVTFTNSDFGKGSDALTDKASHNMFDSEMPLTDAAHGKNVQDKVVKALAAVGVNESDYSVTLRHLTKATHKADGSVEILVDQKRTSDDAAADAVQYATVTIPVTHADDTAAIADEVSTKIVGLVKDYVKDSKAISPKSADKKAQIKEVEANLTKAVNDALADKLDGSNTIASEIDKVEVKVNSYTAATTGTPGYIKKASVVVTFKGDHPDRDFLTNPGTGFTATLTHNDKQLSFDYDGTQSGAPGATNGIALYKLDTAEATSLTLPEETVYSLGADELKVTPNFTPANANNYTIRWTVGKSDVLSVKPNSAATSYTNATKETPTLDNVANGNASAAQTVYLSNDGLTLVAARNAKAGDEVELTADLIDSDGLVAATATTTVKVVKGFSDVQNTHDYAYNAINYLSGVRTVKKNDAYTDVAVITGTGNNMFTPDSDVTRAQFVTFLYRLAQWDGELSDEVATGASITVDGTSKNAENAHGEAVVDASGRVTGYKFPTFKDADASTKFTDVDANAYYAKAVDWAVANGITSGKTDTTFDPNGKVTRAEAVTFLYRYFAANQSYNAADFTDVASTSYYANAVGWASSNGVTQGKTAKTFAPNDTTTRKEAAAFIYRATNTAKINK